MKSRNYTTFFPILLLSLLVGCEHSQAPIRMNNETEGSEQPITVMTYNILHGAGVDSAMESISANQGYPGNRLASILATVISVNPDILGIQEANAWDENDQAVAKQVADSLAMNYVLVSAPTGHHLVLYTKFQIAGVTAYSDGAIFTRAALHARLMPPWGKAIEVFLVHLHPDPSDIATKDREVAFLINKLAPYKNTGTILMGDMNWWIGNSRWHEMLAAEGWQLVAGSFGGKWEVDEIRTTIRLARQSKALHPVDDLLLPKERLDAASDHYPAIARIALH
jgi:endonuclease/exonuclease/phosphatase family metal-dependent hydrolase